MCKKKPKGKVLDRYLAVINQEKAKFDKQKAAKAKAKAKFDSESDSDTDMSLNIIDQKPISKKTKVEDIVPQSGLSDNEKTEEERAYLKILHEGEETETSTLSGN